MPHADFQPRQIFIVHPAIWAGMQLWARQRNFHLHRIPDGANEDGIPFFSDDPETTPTYAFMSKDI